MRNFSVISYSNSTKTNKKTVQNKTKENKGKGKIRSTDFQHVFFFFLK
jgi:hypothetical protein